MTKLFKKSLALLLTLALCLSAMACCFLVSAEGESTPVGSISFVLNDEGDINPGDDVTIDVVANWTGVAGAEFTVTGIPAEATVATTNTEVVINHDAAAGTVKFVDGNNGELSDEAPLFSISFTAGAKDTTYTFEIDEDTAVFCNLAEEDVVVTSEATSFTVVEKTPEHTHNYVATVTTQPTKDAEGVMTYTCECGEGTYTEAIAPASKRSETVGYNIALNSSIDVAFTVPNTLTKSADVVDYYAVVTKNLYVGNAIYSAVVDTFASDVFVTHNTKRDKFVYSGVTAKDMSNTINVTVYFQKVDGTFEYIELDFKLTDYVDGTIAALEAANAIEGNTKNTQLITLLMDMVVYGSYSQQQFNYNTDNLANAAYETYIAKYASTGDIAYATSYDDVPLSGATHKVLSSLAVESSITIQSEVRLANNSKFTSTDALAGYYAKLVIDGDTSNPIIVNSSDFVCNGKATYITYSGFTTRQKANTVSFTLYDANDNAVSNTRTYSIETYAYQIAIESGVAVGQTIRDLSDAMVRFLTAAEVYFAA